MHAIVRELTYDTSKLAGAQQELAEFGAEHAAQPGYAGNVVVDLGDGRRLAVTLWETRQHAATARSVMGPHARRLIAPLMREPSNVVGVGEVVATDLIAWDSREEAA